MNFSKWIKIRLILSIIITISSLILLPKEEVLAQSCGQGTTTFIDYCNSDCSPHTKTLTYTCQNYGGTCVGAATDARCYLSGGACQYEAYGFVWIPCGSGGGGGGGPCPSECRANSCGAGFEGASGCTGCNANQVCCRQTSCGGPGVGSCPAGQVATYYVPPQYWCASYSDPLYPNRNINDTCDGPPGKPYTNEKGYCAPPPCNPVQSPVYLAPSGTQVCSAAASLDVNFYWNAVSGATSYSLRIDDQSNPWTGTCAATNPGDTCLDLSDNSYLRSVIPGHSYGFWVHANNACSQSAAAGATVIYPVCASSPTPSPSPSPTPSPSPSPTPSPPPPANGAWWQVKDGDVTSSGDITSRVASGSDFADDGVGGFPGVPVFDTNFSHAPGGISSTDWNADTETVSDRIFDYSYFEGIVPDDITFMDASTSSLTSGGSLQNGYYWYKFDGTQGASQGQDMIISANTDLLNRKVILFVKGADLDIAGKINLNNGTGFFMAIVDGQIRVNPTVTGSPSLEGIYLSQSSFSTGVGASQLHIRGSVASFGNFTLQRDLANDSSPAELFEYAPDQIMLFPSILATKKTKWIEVAP